MAETDASEPLLSSETLLYRAATKAAHLDHVGDLSPIAFYRLSKDWDGLSVFLDLEIARTRLKGVRAVGRLRLAEVRGLHLDVRQTPPEDPAHAVIEGLPLIDSDEDSERILAERLARHLAALCSTVWHRDKTS